MKRAGFTIWELLAVILVILIVAALLFPVFDKAHECAHCLNCGSNEKQIGLALTQYVQDNDESMPDVADAKDHNDTWRTMLYTYTKSKGVFLCPNRGEKITTSDPKFDTPDGFPESYAANYTGNYSGGRNDQGQGIFAGPGSMPINDKDIPDPRSLIVLCEIWHSSRAEFNIDNLGAFHPHNNILWAGHQENSAYLFADGHCKYLQPLASKDLWHRDASIPLSAGAMNVLSNAHKADE